MELNTDTNKCARKRLWYAVSGSGQGCVFTTFPLRDESRKVWLGEVDGLYSRLVMQMESEGFPLPCMRWGDEPYLLHLTLSGHAVQEP